MLKQGKWVLKEGGLFFITDYVINDVKLVRITMQAGKPSFIKIYIGAQPVGYEIAKGGIEYLKKLAIADLEKAILSILDGTIQEING